jgi:hypothetical protein
VPFKNEYEIREDFAILVLKKRNGESYEAIIDIDDLKKLKEYDKNWCTFYDKSAKSYYVKTTKYKGIIDGKKRSTTVQLHRFIMNVDGENAIIDHINHNTLDNRKSNLRITDKVVNGLNRKGAQQNSKSGIRGVTYCKRDEIWIAAVRIHKRPYVIGRYKTKQEASEQYNIKAPELITNII